MTDSNSRTSQNNPASDDIGSRSKLGGNTNSAKNSNPSAAKPFVKWVGGKRSIVAKLAQRVPANIGAYYEPFVCQATNIMDT